jgi:hypothetical protein
MLLECLVGSLLTHLHGLEATFLGRTRVGSIGCKLTHGLVHVCQNTHVSLIKQNSGQSALATIYAFRFCQQSKERIAVAKTPGIIRCVESWNQLSQTIQTLADGASSANHTNLCRTSLLGEGSTSAKNIVGAVPRLGKSLVHDEVNPGLARMTVSFWNSCWSSLGSWIEVYCLLFISLSSRVVSY